jgi:hypothetical protein
MASLGPQAKQASMLRYAMSHRKRFYGSQAEISKHCGSYFVRGVEAALLAEAMSAQAAALVCLYVGNK